MSTFTVFLIIFTAAMGILTASLYGVLLLLKLFGFTHQRAARWSFGVSTVGIIALLALSGESYEIVCTWMSGLSLLGVGGILIALLARSIEWRR